MCALWQLVVIGLEHARGCVACGLRRGRHTEGGNLEGWHQRRSGRRGLMRCQCYRERVPDATEVLARELARMLVEGCLGELHTACGISDRQGFVNRPVGRSCWQVRAPHHLGCRPQRMATWLAVLHVFRICSPLQGDCSTGPITRQRPGPSLIPLWARSRSCAPRCTNGAGISGAADLVPHLGATASSSHRSDV